MDNTVVVLLLLLNGTLKITAAPTSQNANMICAQYVAPGMMTPASEQTSSDEYNYEDDGNDEPVQEYKENSQTFNGEIQCPNRNDVCYSVWKIGQNGTTIIIRQGCWQSDDKQETCSKSHCTSDKTGTSWSKNYRFCCCSGNRCNINITSIESSSETATSFEINATNQPLIVSSILQSPVIWISIFIIFLTFIILTIFLMRKKSSKPIPELAPLAPAGPGYSSNLHNVDNLTLCSMIGQGKFGTVWKGMINEHPVAVKIFPAQHKQYFLNEKNIYSMQFMNNPSILEYYGSDTRRTFNDNIEYLLVLALAPLGCLQDWLIENTCSFSVFCKMAITISRGLSHLHSPLKKDDAEKPCVCHRDLNTRNILVKADLTCCISDYGFALKTFGPRYEWKGEINLAETKSINEVGTLRYMAPEILEGAVNLRDCETALKQIDVYSLGIVLWELSVRCHDWYPNGQTPPAYKAPYEAELGKNAAFEQMQIIVSRHKTRPAFPPNWGGDLASKITRETCEDCWDHDAEARLTALCVEERIHELTVCGSRSSSQGLHLPNKIISSKIPKNMLNTLSATNFTQNSYPNSDATMITPPNQIIPNVNSDSVDTILSDSLIVTKNRSTIPTFQNRFSNVSADLVPKSNGIHIDGLSENSIKDISSSVGKYEHFNRKTRSPKIKPNNVDRKIKGWHKVRTMIQKKLFKRYPYRFNHNEEKSNLVDSNLVVTVNASPIRRRPVAQNDTSTKSEIQIKKDPSPRPSNLDLSRCSVDDQQTFKRAPGQHLHETFAIVNQPKIVVSYSGHLSKQYASPDSYSVDERYLKRQRSLELFNEVFGAKGSIERLRNPSERVKTPGDVPPSVRKVRASKTLSLYDDRMMDTSSRNTL